MNVNKLEKAYFYNSSHRNVVADISWLTEKLYKERDSILICCKDQETVEVIDDFLWRYKEDGFIPHSIEKKERSSIYPVLITTDIDEEHKLVRHTLVARLNVWKRSIDAEAAEYLHYGATTVDIWDTVLVLQIKDSIDLLIDDLLEIEDYLLTLTKDNLNTYMPGRTLGQHALPITFGKKTSTWLAENRRNLSLIHI